jgi:uncharacterized repeat protein (TIGR03803 family)
MHSAPNRGEKHMRNGKQKGNDGARTNAAAMGGWLRGLSFICVVLTAAMTSPAQEEQPSASTVRFKVLFNFSGADFLAYPVALAQGTDGNLYGTTWPITTTNPGTLYRLTPAGTLTTIYNFCSQPNCADGGNPSQPLTLGTDGDFCGATSSGGASGNGTIFKVTPSGALTVLYNICSQANCADGSFSVGLTLGGDGNFYGAMFGGGAYNNGTVFQLTPQGALTTLYSFCSQTNCVDGSHPEPPPVFGADGNLYGITYGGGAYGAGSIYRLTLGGKLTTLHSLDFSDGGIPNSLVLAPDGDFYGLAGEGGTGDGPFNGVFFRITPSGAYTVLYNFCSLPNCGDGGAPATLVYANDGNFYGANDGGGNTTASPCVTYGCGTIFKMTPKGVLTTLHVFNGTTGGFGNFALAQATNGSFYGTDDIGGTNGGGAIFALSAGLSPFVQLVPTSGKVGEAIQILGSNLTGASSVTFNGTPAAFLVSSRPKITEITAIVPVGASSGTVQVVIPSGTLSSNVPFRVHP